MSNVLPGSPGVVSANRGPLIADIAVIAGIVWLVVWIIFQPGPAQSINAGNAGFWGGYLPFLGFLGALVFGAIIASLTLLRPNGFLPRPVRWFTYGAALVAAIALVIGAHRNATYVFVVKSERAKFQQLFETSEKKSADGADKLKSEVESARAVNKSITDDVEARIKTAIDGANKAHQDELKKLQGEYETRAKQLQETLAEAERRGATAEEVSRQAQADFDRLGAEYEQKIRALQNPRPTIEDPTPPTAGGGGSGADKKLIAAAAAVAAALMPEGLVFAPFFAGLFGGGDEVVAGIAKAFTSAMESGSFDAAKFTEELMKSKPARKAAETIGATKTMIEKFEQSGAALDAGKRAILSGLKHRLAKVQGAVKDPELSKLTAIGGFEGVEALVDAWNKTENELGALRAPELEAEIRRIFDVARGRIDAKVANTDIRELMIRYAQAKFPTEAAKLKAAIERVGSN